MTVSAAGFVLGMAVVPVGMAAMGLALIFGWSWFWEPNPELARVFIGIVVVWFAVFVASAFVISFTDDLPE